MKGPEVRADCPADIRLTLEGNLVAIILVQCSYTSQKFLKQANDKSQSVIPVTEVSLGESTEGEIRRVVALERVRGGCGAKCSRKGVDRGAQSVNALLPHISCLGQA